jgi:predicted CXXCH cytochrome family protein
LDTAAGILQSETNARRCFGCHATGDTPGVHCQRCHGEGAGHPEQKTIRRDPSVALCAECHRSPNRDYASPEPELEDPASIRFAPVGLTASRCFKESKGKLTCVTCHDPHSTAPVVNAKVSNICADCHSSPARKACPREREVCILCHMPKSSPIPLLTFTDHRIR